MKTVKNQKGQDKKQTGGKDKLPTTLYELLVYLIRNFIRSLPKRIIFAVVTFFIILGVHTYLMVYINDGFTLGRKHKVLNYILMLKTYVWGRDEIFWDRIRVFKISLFWALISVIFWSSVGQIRALGPKLFLLKIVDGLAKLVWDIFEKPGSYLLSLFIGAVFSGYLLGMFIGNPLVALLLSILIFLSVCARGTSLMLLVAYLIWNDLQRLFKVNKKRVFYIDIVSMVFRGMSLGLLVYFIMPLVQYGGTIQYIVLVAFIALLLLNIFKWSKPPKASFLFLLASFLLMARSNSYADDGGWSEAGGSFWNWIRSEGAWEAFRRGLAPALSAVSMALGFVPILGDLKDAQEALTGIDLITGEKLSTTDRLITGLAMFIPIVNGKVLRSGGELAELAFKHGDEALDFAGRYADDALAASGRYADDLRIPSRADLDTYRAQLNVPDTHTIAVGKTDVPSLENIDFNGASPRVRKEANLPTLDDIAPNREVKAPTNVALNKNHAEEGLMFEFDEAVKKAGLDPQDVNGTLNIHQSNPKGVCPSCLQGLNNPDVKPGIFKQFSEKYPNLTIKVTSELVEGVKPFGRQSFTLLNGKFID